jgi:hypothetical protein
MTSGEGGQRLKICLFLQAHLSTPGGASFISALEGLKLNESTDYQLL